MPVSLNLWPVVQSGSSRLASGFVPGVKRRHSVTCAKVALPVFLAALSDVNATVCSLETGPLDGHHVRPPRNGGGWSNHSSGTAVDFRYDLFPADNRRHMSNGQIAAMHRILDTYRTSGGKRIFGWGGDWHLVDEMHLELGQAWQPGVGSRVTEDDVKSCIARLKINPDGTRAGSATSTEDDMALSDDALAQIRQIVHEEVAASVKAEVDAVWERQFKDFADGKVRAASWYLVNAGSTKPNTAS